MAEHSELSDSIELQETNSGTILLIESTTNGTSVVPLTRTQAATVQKLLEMSGDPIPSYRDKRYFALGESIPSEPGDTPGPFIEAPAGSSNNLVIYTEADRVHLTPRIQAELETALRDWGYKMDEDTSVITFPEMVQLEDGISEPMLLNDADEVLEHYHAAIGYWSPEQGDYVVKHN